MEECGGRAVEEWRVSALTCSENDIMVRLGDERLLTHLIVQCS